MPHSVGALLLPAPADDGALTDPGIDILAAYFQAVLTAWLATAWLDRAPSEPIVRTLSTHNPEDYDFTVADLPLLSVYREEDAAPKRLTDAYQETEDAIHILWIPPPATQFKNSRRAQFFNAFNKAISLAARNERDPSYVHASEAANVAALAYGSDVIALTKIDWWRLTAIRRVPVEIPFGSHVERLPGYMATLIVGETTVVDPAVYDLEPTVLSTTLNTGGQSPLITNQILTPPDADS